MAQSAEPDFQALLEAPFAEKKTAKDGVTTGTSSAGEGESEGLKDLKEKDDRSDRNRDRSRDRRRSRSRDRRRSRSRSRDRRRSRSRDRDRRRRSRSREYRRRSRSRSRSRRDRSRDRRRENERWSRGPRRGRSPSPTPNEDPEREARTVLCAQLAQRLTSAELKEFFEKGAGKVNEARIVSDRNSRRSKGIAYVEFASTDSVPAAISMSGQRLLGVPMIITPSMSERNRLAAAAAQAKEAQKGGGQSRVFVAGLHPSLGMEEIRQLFEPFGQVDDVQLHIDLETGKSKGFAFVVFRRAPDARMAAERLNNFDIGGHAIRVGLTDDNQSAGNAGGRTGGGSGGFGAPMSSSNGSLDDDAGIRLNSVTRAQLMANLNRDGELASYTSTVRPVATAAPDVAAVRTQSRVAGSPSEYVLLKNMFDPAAEEGDSWDADLRDDVVDEMKKHGRVLHASVDRYSQGHIYLHMETVAAATALTNANHGRWFGGRQISAEFIDEGAYTARFGRT